MVAFVGPLCNLLGCLFALPQKLPTIKYLTATVYSLCTQILLIKQITSPHRSLKHNKWVVYYINFQSFFLRFCPSIIFSIVLHYQTISIHYNHDNKQ